MSTSSKAVEHRPVEEQREYWSRKLSSLSESAGLTPDYQRPIDYSPVTDTLDVTLPDHVCRELNRLAGNSSFLLYAVLLAALKICLHKYTGSRTIVVGSPARKKSNELFQKPNALPIVVEVQSQLSFREFLIQVRETLLQTYQHQNYSFARMVSDLQLEDVKNRCPIFDVAMVLKEIHIDLPEVKNDLTITFARQSDQISGQVVFRRELFRPETIARFIGHFTNVLSAGLQDTNTAVNALQMLDEPERQQVVREWNDTFADYPSKLIHQLFEAQVVSAPDAVAVVLDDEQVSYLELDRRANQLAHYLTRAGVGPDARVSVLIERSIEMIVGVLGVLKAGAAYVPLNVSYPAERLAYMIEDAQSFILLTQESLKHLLPQHGPEIICLDTDREAIARMSEENPGAAATPANLAYVTYTSGSTGTPKGVMIPHHALVNRILSLIDLYRLDASHRLLQFLSLSFDASAEEIYPTLAGGATLILHRHPSELSTAELLLTCETQRITTLHLPPAYWQHMADELSVAQCYLPPVIKMLITGGESFSIEKVRTWIELSHDSFSFINAYGPTEATVTATVYEARELGTLRQLSKLPIGRPVANTQIYILGVDLQPVPIGVAGELYIGGEGLGRGYFNRPELTAEMFLPDPFSKRPGALFYRTGDLTRFLPDGNVEFLGRLDDQVKVRAYRVELAEIEAALLQHPAVAQAVVIARHDNSHHQRLLAYVVAHPGAADGTGEPAGANTLLTLSAAELRLHLKGLLPDYMVPNSIMQLQVLPLSPNGKVDRRALPEPEAAQTDGAAPRPPRTAAEESLARIWSDVLGIPQAGIHDNFFELGGDSIISIQIVSRAKQVGLQLTPKQLFDYPTIAELAAVAGSVGKTEAEQGVVSGTVPLTPIQHWFFEQELIERRHFNQAVLLQVRADYKVEVIDAALGALVHHHDALRLRYRRTEQGWEQFNAAEETHPILTYTDLSELSTSEQPAAIEAQAAQWQASLDLEHGPLVRAVYFDLAEEQAGRLLLIVHHLAVDGVSWRILLDDLQLACEQLRQGEAVNLREKSSSYKQWAEQLEEYAESAEVKAEVRYWTDERWRNVRRLPVDYEDAANRTESSQSVSVELSEEETQWLLHEVADAYGTQIQEVLLTALVEAVRRWSGEPRVLVDLEGHGREEVGGRVEVSRTVGWFTTLFPVLLELQEGNDPGSALKRVKEEMRRVPNRGIGYGLLRYLSRDEELRKRLRELPAAEISFNYLGQLDQILPQTSPFLPAPESSGPTQSPREHRLKLMNVNGRVGAGRLQVTWTYSENFYRHATIEALANSFKESLRSLIMHCLSPEAGGYTPSDFPLAGLDQEELDLISAGRKRAIEDIYPLSPMQLGMLFHNLYAPKSEAYSYQVSCLLRGDLNVSAFERAWQRVVDRHAILRTYFVWEGIKKPLQVVPRQVKFKIAQLDWRELGPGQQQQQLQTFVSDDRRRGFDLSSTPLFRQTLIRVSDNAYYFIWCQHHLTQDGWSMPLLLKEVFAFYEAFSLDQDLRLDLPRPYRDYISWLQHQDHSQAEAFWRQTLKGFTAPTSLPGLSSTTAEFEQPHFDVQQRRLSADVTRRLQTFARAHELTLNTLVQGAWALLLSRYSGERDVVFGVVVSGRPAELSGSEKMVGLFINTLPLRVQVDGAKVVEWLKKIQDGQVEARQYEYASLVDVQGWSEVKRGVGLFESLLVFENYPIDSSVREENGSLQVEEADLAKRDGHHPLFITATPGPELSLKINYDSHRFPASIIRQTLVSLETLLANFAQHPDVRLERLSEILDQVDKQQQMLQESELEQLSLSKLKNVRRRAAYKA